MIYMLDTSVCVEYFRRPGSPIHQWLHAANRKYVRLCAVIQAELLVGIHKNPTEENRRKVLNFLAAFECWPFDGAAAEAYAAIRADLERKGKLIGPYDLQIAAVAMSRGATLVTGNEDEFQRVPGLACLPLKALAGKTPY